MSGFGSVTAQSRSSRILFGGTGILLLAFALRIAPVAAARPYIAYVDEGNVLHSVVGLLRDGGWDPRWYLYPQLPGVVVKASLRAYGPIYQAIHGHPLSQDLSGPPEVYDLLEPFEVLLVARILNAVSGVIVVALTGLFARRLAGVSAGLAAALLAALAPALVLRGSIATVDSYATLFVLASLIFTDLSRSPGRTLLASFLAGAMAGFAFASKYPSVVVLAAFGATTLLEPIGAREKLRRLALATVGLVTGATLAMPALVHHGREVYAAIRNLGAIYTRISSPSLAHQAFLVAEPNLVYGRAELGFVFLAFAAAGLVIGLRDTRLRPLVGGWVAFAGIAVVIHSHQFYQPFRNLMPLVPLACLAAAIAFTHLRQRMRRPGWADAVACVWVFAFFGVPVASDCWKRARLVDSRVEAVDWLASHVRNGDSVLAVRELGFLNQELARLGPRPTVRWWNEAAPAIESLRPRFLVAGVLLREDGTTEDVAALNPVLAAYSVRARYGERPTVPFRSWWRGNRQVISILERRTETMGDNPTATNPPAPVDLPPGRSLADIAPR